VRWIAGFIEAIGMGRVEVVRLADRFRMATRST